jgi:hypothetical protein
MATKHVLRAQEGYHFNKTGTHSVALMKGTNATTTFTCDCDTSGGCRVDMDGTSASCENSGCSGDCKWSIHLPGLHGVLIASHMKVG